MKLLLFSICLVLSALLAACSPRAPVSQAIDARLTNVTSINIAELTPFAWDTLHIYSPYSARQDICSKLGSAWNSCKTDLPDYIDEGEYLLAFTGPNGIVHHEYFHRRRANFCEKSCALKVPREKAVFAVQTQTPEQKPPRYRLTASAA